MKKIILFVLFVILSNGVVNAQFEDRIEKLQPIDLENYLRPLATFTGSVFNSGGYHSASTPSTFSFGFSLIGMYVTIPDDQLKFKPALSSDFGGDIESATIFGDKGGVFLGNSGFAVYPGGINVSSIPAAMPQITVGFVGSEVLLRAFPTISVDDVDISFFGFGIKHSVSRYIPMSPVDVAVQVMYNKFSLTSTTSDINIKSLAINVHASKSFKIFSVYGGLQYENSTSDVEYRFTNPNNIPGFISGDKLSVSIDGDNSFRATLGAMVKFAIIGIHADVNLSSQTVFTTGFSLEF